MPEEQISSGLLPHLDTISREVGEKIASSETPFVEGQDERDALHQVVGEKLGKESGGAPALPTSSSSQGDDELSYESSELKPKVDELLNIAVSKDLDDAIKQAKSQGDPALLDAFHDAIVDKLYAQLVEGGKLKQIK
ncbi:hypothetical protein KKH05_02510 [Patescibacteria group bacterium]|nr:hypothetical protein [Patescibacteria group bacterium]